MLNQRKYINIINSFFLDLAYFSNCMNSKQKDWNLQNAWKYTVVDII